MPCQAAERNFRQNDVCNAPEPGYEGRIRANLRESRIQRQGLLCWERTMYTGPPKVVDAAMNCGLGGSVEDQGRFCISFQRRGALRERLRGQ